MTRYEFSFRKGAHRYVYRFGDLDADHDAIMAVFRDQIHDPRLDLDLTDLAQLCGLLLVELQRADRGN